MATIKEDIEKFSEMIIQGFKNENLSLDYTLTSFKDIDKFYDNHSKDGQPIDGGRFSKNLGQILFALGAYVGQTIIINIPGTEWVIDENDKYGEINASLKLPNETIVWPMQKTIKRFRNGTEDSIYGYGYHILKEYVDIEKLLANEQLKKKTWWKFGM